MALPVIKVTVPSNIAGLESRQIGACHLEQVWFPGVGYSSLNPVAKRCWNGLVIACLAETGQTLTAISTQDAYRSYQTQVTAFRARYTLTWSATVNKPKTAQGAVKVWNGVTYYLRLGMIPCAVPGGGWHPKGLAVDIAIYDKNLNDGDPYPGDPRWIKSNAWLWAWLKLNVVSLGWSWEYSTEGVDDPHLHYFAGDQIPGRVLQIEDYFAKLAQLPATG